jgi:hypothetical protein
LNELVYREAFLSPLDDPWYGLKSDAYTGLDGEAEGDSHLAAAARRQPGP